MGLREKALLKRIKSGDRGACVTLIDRHYQQVYWYLLDLSRNEETAADLTQNTFANAWRAVGRFEGRSTFRTWLFSIARNEFLTEVRKSGRYPELMEFSELEVMEDPAPSPEEHVAEQDLLAAVRARVAELPGRYREVVSLHYFSRMTLREVAGVLNIPSGTVKSRIHKALSLLKDNLAGLEIGDESDETEEAASFGG